jgi:hypothetical protein
MTGERPRTVVGRTPSPPGGFRSRCERPSTALLRSAGAQAFDDAQLLEPFETELVRAGVAHVWDAASSRGASACSSFYATQPRIDASRDAIAALIGGESASPGDLVILRGWNAAGRSRSPVRQR